MNRVEWFRRDPGGSTLYTAVRPVEPARPPRAELDELATRLRNLDPERIQADVLDLPPMDGCCDLCHDLCCKPNVVVRWSSWLHGEQEYRMNREHVEGWASGLMLPDLARDGSACIEIGRAA